MHRGICKILKEKEEELSGNTAGRAPPRGCEMQQPWKANRVPGEGMGMVSQRK